jgi:hypothetical protein
MPSQSAVAASRRVTGLRTVTVPLRSPLCASARHDRASDSDGSDGERSLRPSRLE